MTHPAEAERGVYLPVQVYPMFETAIRAAAGADARRAPRRAVSELWARLQRRRRRQPGGLDPRGQVGRGDPHDDAAATASSGCPYRKYMNSNNDVDMAAAVIMCSVEAARRLGVPEDRWVFPHAGTDCHEHAYVSNRDTFARTPAIELGGRRALELAGVGIDDIAIVDLYSCFPSAVQLGAQSLGLSTRPPADAHRRPGVRRRTVEQLRDARHRHGRRRPPRAARRARPGVGQRRLRHEARLRRLQHRAAGRRVPPRRPPGRDRRPAAAASWRRSRTPPARRRSRPTR